MGKAAGGSAGGGAAGVAAIDGGTGEATVTGEQMTALDQFAKDLNSVARAITTTPPGQIRGTHSQTAVNDAVANLNRTSNRLMGNELRLPDSVSFSNSPAGRLFSGSVDRASTFGSEARNFGRSIYSRNFIASSLRSAVHDVRRGMRIIRRAGGGY